jgi:hypothetical protein
MNVFELQVLAERARSEDDLSTRPPTDLLGRARRARRGRRRVVGAALAGSVAVAVIGVAATAFTGGDPDATPPSTIGQRDAPAGDPATWVVEDPRELGATTTSFSVLVSRYSCGENGPIDPPVITYEASRIVVRLSVARLEPGVVYDCVGHPGAPYDVVLEQPINGRNLVDGACEPGQPAATSGACTFVDPVRWSPTDNASTNPCYGTAALLFQDGRNYRVFPEGGHVTLSATGPVAWTTIGPCADVLRYRLDSEDAATSPIPRGGLVLRPGSHRLTVEIPMCAGRGGDCRGGLISVTSHIEVR